MGRPLGSWVTQVQSLILDGLGVDVDEIQVVDVGVTPALAQYSIDKPRRTAADIVASARYLPFPSEVQGWSEGFSEIVSIEAPAGKTPPDRLLDSEWDVVSDPASAAVARILLPSDHAGQTCRVSFTAAWPVPTTDPNVDVLGTVAFQAVCALAASMVCSSMAALAARDRQGALPTDFVDGSDRARQLLDAAQSWRIVYQTFIGLGSVAGGNPSTSERAMSSSTLGSSTKRLSAGFDSVTFAWWPR
jgi:hypothetical protein